ncbi:glycoside hydrolase family 30 beta sandwich domain-containing protein [Paenibacillus sp.]|uniref:glycoside hydrolase family 30 beta sandwich domain-containing protein n=1 Tax=Paenibacillus sp. TaxID=58172 RepID=UPI002D2C3667|nr:glycoside hydrolase family 30 beta sandwich domain-containing protein [Paenibacillus sp.]HZG86841.1 glycoside hydrolase family 30 beta sandwich domain-containing protein [Paenibacillus sp.]
MKRFRRWLMSAIAVALWAGSFGAAAPKAEAAPSLVEVYYSSESNTVKPKDRNWYWNTEWAMSDVPYQLSRQPDIAFTSPTGTNVPAIAVHPDQRYQTILGIGTSLEESTIYNLSLMSAGKREEVLRKLIDPVNGAGMSLFRITFGASDFTGRPFYTYEDTPGQFSIQKDIDYNIVETIKQAIAIGKATGNPIRIFASSWTAPAWMKTNDSILGDTNPSVDGVGEGYLRREHTNNLAAYYRKAIQAYQAQGIPIYAMTIQNEPLFPAPYPGMLLTPDNERELTLAMKAEFDAHNLHTKLWSFDHNFADVWKHVPGILDNAQARAAVDGVAFHDYAGEPATMTDVHNIYPEKNMMVTERAVWGTAGADRIAQYFRHWSTTYVNWVTMLDQDWSPEQWSGDPDPTMLIQSKWNRDQYWATPEYNFFAQYAKFVRPGAKRIGSDYGFKDTVTNVSFLNTDNTVVSVVINQNDSPRTFKIQADGYEFIHTIPKFTVATFKWARSGSSAGAPIGATIAVKSMANGQFVAAENAGADALIANRNAVGTWEKFQVVDAGGGYIALKSLANNKFVAAEHAGASSLIARSDAPQEWEQFRWIDNGDGTFSLLSNANMKYVTAENGGSSPLIANRMQIADWEKFQYFIQ